VIAAAALLMMIMSACREDAPPSPETAASPTGITLTATPVENTATPTSAPTATATGTQEPTPLPSPSPTPFSGGPDDFPAFVNPLTGQLVFDTSLLERHPVMVKVSNFPRSLRPHSGLSWADIVFEYYIGAGATRFSAVYYGQNPPEAGPVRSGRLIDAQLGNFYNAILAFASADPIVYSRILTSLGDRAITEGPSTCPAICRTGTGDVNSVRAYPEELTRFAEEDRGVTAARQDLNGTVFDTAALEGGDSGLVVTIRYSFSTISEWRYDEATGLYLRYIEEVDSSGAVSIIPLVDALNGEQLTAANVIVLFAETIEMKPTLHDFSLADNYAGRRALLFRDGQVYEIQWRSQGPNLPIQFFDDAGELIPLKPGNTWFHVVGLNSSTAEDSDGVWTVANFIP
jgi:hypothetical protein